MKILLVNHSDVRGGASVVTRRLMDALCAEGVDARMLVVHKGSGSLRVDRAASPSVARVPFLAEHAEIYGRNGFNRDTLFRISTGRFGLPLHRHPWVRGADAVIVNWVNQGMLSLDEVSRIAAMRPVIWVMHDQWNMTGVCHYTAGCERWRTVECRGCPLVGRGSLAHSVYMAKARTYARAGIRFVAVCNLLAQLCRQSPLMAEEDIRVIPNAFPVDRFPVTPSLSRRNAGLPETGRLIALGAARLDDPVKNLPLAVEALNMAQTQYTGNEPLHAVLFGAIRNPRILDTLSIPYTYLGPIENHSVLQSVMAHTDVVLSTSLWETLPGTVVEGIAAGAVGVTGTNGGQTDIIDTGVTGYTVDGDDPAAYARAIVDALALPTAIADRQQRHLAMAAKFGSPSVARQYIDLIRSVLDGKKRG